MEFNAEQIIVDNLTKLGFTQPVPFFYNLTPAELIEKAIRNGEGVFSNSGALDVDTTPYTGRSPNDKYYVDYDDPEIWLAEGSKFMTLENFNYLKARMLSSMSKKKLFIRDVFVGAHPSHRIKISVITELAWQNLASANMFIATNDPKPFIDPDFNVIVSSTFASDPQTDGTRSEPFVAIDLRQKLILIGTTQYGGEIKKSVFTIMNYLMPKMDILSLHCSANQGTAGDVALFFGLSGTGKTTLSSDTNRALIGDDEHGWSEDGIFNFEGGCYAKTIHLKQDLEPLVWSAVNRFGALLENVPLTRDRVPDFDDNRITENTRSAYPLHFISNYEPKGYGTHPTNIFLLTADAFGVLPPLAKLSNEQALYYFLSGYTSKLAGTERGLGSEPQATFSACFGAPFLPLHPGVYANLLGQRLEKYQTKVWLLNTGWTGGGYGVGNRISLPYTRALINSVLNGSLNDSPTYKHPIFNLQIPLEVEDVPSYLLNPEEGWQNKADYVKAARSLADQFKENIKKFDTLLSNEVRTAGPN